MASKEASDLHLKPMRPPLLRIKGKLVPLKSEALQPKELEDMLLEILTPAQKQKLEDRQSLGQGVEEILVVVPAALVERDERHAGLD